MKKEKSFMVTTSCSQCEGGHLGHMWANSDMVIEAGMNYLFVSVCVCVCVCVLVDAHTYHEDDFWFPDVCVVGTY